MERVQVRVVDRTPQEVVSDLAEVACLATERALHIQIDRGVWLASVRRAITQALSPFLFRFKDCGSQKECHRGRSLREPKVQLTPERWFFETEGAVIILHVIADVEIDEVLAEIVESVVGVLQPLFKDESDGAVLYTVVKELFLSYLAPIIVNNPSCGERDVCHRSQRLNPWTGQALG